MADIHIIAPFSTVKDESWQAIDLYLTLRKKNNVYLWSSRLINSELTEYTINEIRPYHGQLPSDGTLYIVGCQNEIGAWYEHARFERIIFIHNQFLTNALYQNLHRLTCNGTRKIEIQYASRLLKDAIGISGEVVYPFPHPERFHHSARETTQNCFTVGRISEDIITKHHFADPDFYRKLSAIDICVRVIGGTCLQPWLTDTQKNIELLIEVPQASIPAILNTLDCFYYRTALGAREAFGIRVVEAMLCGLPVVCDRQGGYAEVIEHGENGFLFDTEEEAFEIICRLKNNSGLRKKIGRNARQLS